MFLKNISKQDIYLRSFEGYVFAVPPGVSAIWTPAGEALLAVHKVETKPEHGKADKYGFANGHGLPALFQATEAEWKKGGKHLAKVERFKITVTLPRASLIQTALKRGLSHSRITEYQLDPNIDTETISNEINSLPIPDEIKYPVSIEDEDKINE